MLTPHFGGVAKAVERVIFFGGDEKEKEDHKARTVLSVTDCSFGISGLRQDPDSLFTAVQTVQLEFYCECECRVCE